MKKYTQFIKSQQDLEYEAKFNKKENKSKTKISLSQVNISYNADNKLSSINPNVPAAMNNYTTNYSSNNPPPQSGSQIH